MALILLIDRLTGGGRSTLILAGVAVSSLMSAGVNLLITLRPESVADRTAFQMGSLHGIQPAALGMATALVLPGLAAAQLLKRGLALFALGDEAAHGLGLPVRRYRLLALLASTLLCAAAVSACGLIGFVGLIVPNLARRIVEKGAPGRVALCAALGGGFLVLCDALARSLAHPYELPVGMLLSFLTPSIGTPWRRCPPFGNGDRIAIPIRARWESENVKGKLSGSLRRRVSYALNNRERLPRR